MSERFKQLISNTSREIRGDYEEARAHARERDAQRAGHEGEATWVRFLQRWGPAPLPIVTRKYIVGPSGESNEVDLVVLKPEYPVHLREEASILASGVAAAFSVKLTFRMAHLAEALAQKKKLASVAGPGGGTPRDQMCGAFPYGLLSHGSELKGAAPEIASRILERYDVLEPELDNPREELDCLLIADACFISTIRHALGPRFVPTADGASSQAWGPSTVFARHRNDEAGSGLPLAQFVTWLHARLAANIIPGNSLSDLQPIFGGMEAQGYGRQWPMDIFSEEVRANPRMLLNVHGLGESYL